MIFNELKNVLVGQYHISFDYDILCDIAEAAGFDSLDNRMYDHYGAPEVYLDEMNIKVIHDEPISILDPVWNTLEGFNVYKDDFFGKYKVEKVENCDDTGLVIYLVHE